MIVKNEGRFVRLGTVAEVGAQYDADWAPAWATLWRDTWTHHLCLVTEGKTYDPYETHECPECDGVGSCHYCNGQGGFPIGEDREDCAGCQGSGCCYVCAGKGFATKPTDVVRAAGVAVPSSQLMEAK
jgi:hypothetical protein